MKSIDITNELQYVSTELSKGPIVIRGKLPKYLGFFLDKCTILSEDSKIIDFFVQMDSLEKINEKKVILNPESNIVRRVISSRFNDFNLDLPDLSFFEALNSLGKNKSESLFFSKFSLLKEFILSQSELSHAIVDLVKKTLPDVVIVFMIDGLSATDFNDYLKNHNLPRARIRTVLVDTATITPCAFRNLIYGETHTPISIRLYELGYIPVGFSYWNRNDELLTKQLFHGIVTCKKVPSFGEVGDSLREHLSKDGRLYFQILREGLDNLAHRKREKPNVMGEIDAIVKDMLQLSTIVLESGRKGLIFCCPDHGILWETTNLEPYEKKKLHGKIHERYFAAKRIPNTNPEIIQKDFIKFKCKDTYIHCVRFPFALKRPRSNSCGVHGGISIEESLVPFIQMEVK